MFFTDTLCCIDFKFLVFSKLVIDCVSGCASAFLNLVWGFCVDMGLYWKGALARTWVKGQSPSRVATVRGPLAVGTVFVALHGGKVLFPHEERRTDSEAAGIWETTYILC